MSILLLALVVSISYVSVIGLPNGAPRLACNDMRPRHFVDPQTDPSLFGLRVAKDEATNTFQVTIEKTAADGPPFRGFFIQARDQANARVGVFSDPPAEGSQLITCTAPGDSITHISNVDKESITLDWIPPEGSLSGTRFIMSVVQQVNITWVDVFSDDLGDF